MGGVADAMQVLRRLASRTASASQAVEQLEREALAKAFRGELVSQNLADEPASALLDRIRAARATDPERPRRGRGNRMAATTASNGHAKDGHHDESLDLVVGVFQIDRRLTMPLIAEATGLDTSAVKKALKTLVDSGQVRVDGKARSAAYVWTA